MKRIFIIIYILVFFLIGTATVLARKDSTTIRDLKYFLYRLRTLEHLPEMEDSHTAMSSTWDRNGANKDGTDFKRIEGDYNILLDIDGPGCIHRIFTGRLGEKLEGTRIKMYFDNEESPTIDMEANKFFDSVNGLLPYPLVFHKTYPGTLFPFPFAKHCRVELFNPNEEKKWGNYWQVTYTIYSKEIPVKSFNWPLDDGEKEELKRVCETWSAAESCFPKAPKNWTVERKQTIEPGETAKLNLDKCGVIREMRIVVNPSIPEVLRNIRMRITWDDNTEPSVDVPLGYFFGHGDFGHGDKDAYFSSMLLGVNEDEAFSRFPMPFRTKAAFEFYNGGQKKVEGLTVFLDIEEYKTLSDNWGSFHATWIQQYYNESSRETMRKYGKQDVPVHMVLEKNMGPGKYVGVLLCVEWFHQNWWGEGDWLIWTDEDGWPPSYHGTGCEEYFNSGWGEFDRKAVSGIVRGLPGEKFGLWGRPGYIGVYSFHLNDAFQFQKNIRVADEIMTLKSPDPNPNLEGIWGSTAFWYSFPVQEAKSDQEQLIH